MLLPVLPSSAVTGFFSALIGIVAPPAGESRKRD